MHFYTNEGQPRHYVPMVKDTSKLRPSRISDAKKAVKDDEVWLPSVTTILGILDKPGLNRWLIGQHLIQAYNLVMHCGNPEILENEQAFIEEVKRLADIEMDKAPSAGTDIHSQIERYLKGDTDVEQMGICKNVVSLVEDRTGIPISEFEPEKTLIYEDQGYAGKVDLYHEQAVIDFKSKQFADKFKPGKMAYPDHARQIAAYLGEGAYDAFYEGYIGSNLFICLENGCLDWHEWDSDALENGYETFKDCLQIFNREVYSPFL